MISINGPHGLKLRPLERNILKYRALQMTLTLFYAENLRKELINYVNGGNFIFNSKPRINSSTKNPLKIALEIFFQDKVLTKKECEEIKKLINFRNHIAHRNHQLLSDLSPSKLVHDFIRFSKNKPTYDYDVAGRLKHYKNTLWEKASGKYVWTYSLDNSIFEASERAIEYELGKLDTLIRKQLLIRKKENDALKDELQVNVEELGAHPCDPINHYESGKLTKQGVEICYRLFDQGKNPLAIANIMQISLASAKKRKKQWSRIGGIKRQKMDLSKMKKRIFYRSDD